jgi:hypothetical protein
VGFNAEVIKMCQIDANKLFDVYKELRHEHWHNFFKLLEERADEAADSFLIRLRQQEHWQGCRG